MPPSLEFPAMEFFLKLSSLLRSKKISQQELAILTGMQKSKISRLTTGLSKPFLGDGLALSRALGVPLWWLADDAQPWPPPEGRGDDKGFVDMPRPLGSGPGPSVQGDGQDHPGPTRELPRPPTRPAGGR